MERDCHEERRGNEGFRDCVYVCVGGVCACVRVCGCRRERGGGVDIE